MSFRPRALASGPMAARLLRVYLAVALSTVAIFALAPDLDLVISGMVWDPVREFRFVRWDGGWTLYKIGNVLGSTLLVFSLVAPVVVAVCRRGWVARHRAALIFLSISALIGPGLVVNEGLKDEWGRARPREIVEFGGDRIYTPPLQISDQCDSNCSFPSGHAALGFWFVSIGLVVTRHRGIVVTGALALGLLFGAVRVLQGAHFASDVLFAGLIVVGISWALHAWLIGANGIQKAWESSWMRRLRRLLRGRTLGVVTSRRSGRDDLPTRPS